MQDKLDKIKLLDGLDTIKITPTETLASEKTKIENTYTQILKDEKKLFLSLDKANFEVEVEVEVEGHSSSNACALLMHCKFDASALLVLLFQRD